MLDATRRICRWYAAGGGVYPRTAATLDAGTAYMRLSLRCLIWCVTLLGAAAARGPAEAQLRGHGGPIRALAVSADGTTALSGSFDASAIRWSLRDNLAEQVLRLHESAVNAVAILNDSRTVTAGADAIIGIWTPGKPVPDRILRGHEGADRRARGIARRRNPRLSVMGSDGSPMAACRRSAGHPRRSPAKRERRGLRTRWHSGGQRRL